MAPGLEEGFRAAGFGEESWWRYDGGGWDWVRMEGCGGRRGGSRGCFLCAFEEAAAGCACYEEGCADAGEKDERVCGEIRGDWGQIRGEAR